AATTPCGTVIARLLADNGASVMVSVRILDVPPPAGGLRTVMACVPASASRDAGTVAFRCVRSESVNVVASATPSAWTTELWLRLLPVTVKVNAGLPSTTDGVPRLVIAGSGLLTTKTPEAVDGVITPPPEYDAVTW